MRSPVSVIIELPEMYKLIDRAGIALEVTDQLLVLPTLLERREADLPSLPLADMQRVGSQFVERPWEAPRSIGVSITWSARQRPAGLLGNGQIRAL